MIKDFLNYIERKPELFRKLFSLHAPRNVLGANKSHNVPRHGCSAIVFSSVVPDNHPSFLNHVMRVVFRGSQEKMIWIYTRAKIALMKNAQPFWNKAKMENPRSSMGMSTRIINIGRLSTPDSNASVILLSWHSPSSPFPTWPKFWTVFWNWTVFINSAPKAFWKRLRKSLRFEIFECYNRVHRLIGGSGFVSRQPGPLFTRKAILT